MQHKSEQTKVCSVSKNHSWKPFVVLKLVCCGIYLQKGIFWDTVT